MKRLAVLAALLLLASLAYGQPGKGYRDDRGYSGRGYVNGYVSGVVQDAHLGEMWAVYYGSSFSWDAGDISDMAQYDGTILSKSIPWGSPEMMADMVAENPDIKIASYAMPSTSPTHIWDAPVGHILEKNQTELAPFLVPTTRGVNNESYIAGGVAAGADTAQYNKLRYLIDLNLDGAIDAVLDLFEDERVHLATAEPSIPADAMGIFWDIPTTGLDYPSGDDAPEEMFGDVDFDGDGVAYDIDAQYYSEVGVSSKAAFNRGIRALFAEAAIRYPNSVQFGNGIMAVVDTAISPSMTHIMIERTTSSPPFNWNGWGDLIAGGKFDPSDYGDDDLVESSDWKSLEAYKRIKDREGTQVMMSSTSAVGTQGYNHDALAVAARIYGFSSSSNRSSDGSYHEVDAPDRTMYDTLAQLGKVLSVERNGEHLRGIFENGEANIMVSLARYDETDQVDYWAVTTDGDTLTSHWNGAETYLFTFGDHNRQSGDPNYSNYDRWFGLDGNNRKTRFLQMDQSAQDSYMGDAGAESAVRLTREQTSILGDWGALSFTGSRGVRETSMARALQGRAVKSATLHLFTYWSGMTIAAGDTLFIGAPNDANLVGWDLPIVDQGSDYFRPQPTYNEKAFGGGEFWNLDQYPNPAAMGGVWTSFTEPSLTASTYYSVDVTDLIQSATDPDNFFSGLWFYYRAGTVGSSSLGFDAFSTYLDVEVYAPWAAP